MPAESKLSALYPQKILSVIETLIESTKKCISELDDAWNINYSEQTNATGDTVHHMDLVFNQILITELSKNQNISILYSEELEIPVKTEREDGMSIFFDPLDGSSNIDSMMPFGQIFSVYDRHIDPTEFRVQGKDQLFSAYVLLTAQTHIVICYKNQVNIFTLLEDKLVHVASNYKLGNQAKIYAVNDFNSNQFDQETSQYLDKLKSEYPLKHRYSGCLVSDIHNILINGGVFFYPTLKNSKKDKLRVLYEANPMASILEAVGGEAINSQTKRILDIVATDFHQTTSLLIGTKDLVKNYKLLTK